jgi:hypothetical protein
LVDINRALQGQASSASSSSGVNRINGNDVVHLVDYVGKPVDLLYKDIVSKLGQKANASPKHNNALNEIRAINDIRAIPGILSKYGVEIKNDQIFGGKNKYKYKRVKKTRKQKNKKQRGGFFYKMNSKRKSLLTSTYKRKTSKRSKNSKTSKLF